MLLPWGWEEIKHFCPHSCASNIWKQQQSRAIKRAEVIGVGLWKVGKLLNCSGERVRTWKRSGGIPKWSGYQQGVRVFWEGWKFRSSQGWFVPAPGFLHFLSPYLPHSSSQSDLSTANPSAYCFSTFYLLSLPLSLAGKAPQFHLHHS